MIKYHYRFKVGATDVGADGIMLYYKYLNYFESARSELMRSLGVPFDQLESDGIIMPIIKIDVSYTAGAKLDQNLDCLTEIRDILHNRFEFFYSVRLNADKETELVSGKTVHVFASIGGKTTKLPPELERVFREKWGSTFE